MFKKKKLTIGSTSSNTNRNNVEKPHSQVGTAKAGSNHGTLGEKVSRPDSGIKKKNMNASPNRFNSRLATEPAIISSSKDKSNSKSALFIFLVVVVGKHNNKALAAPSKQRIKVTKISTAGKGAMQNDNLHHQQHVMQTEPAPNHHVSNQHHQISDSHNKPLPSYQTFFEGIKGMSAIQAKVRHSSKSRVRKKSSDIRSLEGANTLDNRTSGTHTKGKYSVGFDMNSIFKRFSMKHQVEGGGPKTASKMTGLTSCDEPSSAKGGSYATTTFVPSKK